LTGKREREIPQNEKPTRTSLDTEESQPDSVSIPLRQKPTNEDFDRIKNRDIFSLKRKDLSIHTHTEIERMQKVKSCLSHEKIGPETSAHIIKLTLVHFYPNSCWCSDAETCNLKYFATFALRLIQKIATHRIIYTEK